MCILVIAANTVMASSVWAARKIFFFEKKGI